MSHLRLADPGSTGASLPPTMGVLFSGGLDSTILLHQVIAHGWRVRPFYVQTGCLWQNEEQAAVDRILAELARDTLQPLVALETPVDDLYADHWSITGHAVPDNHSTDEAVFLPGRNPLLLIKPVLWCAMHGIRKLSLAILAANPFADAKPEFFDRFEAMILQATDCEVRILRPFELLSKRCVMQMGREAPLALTFSCISPVGGLHCGRCNKCAERVAAFAHLDHDPTPYAQDVA